MLHTRSRTPFHTPCATVPGHAHGHGHTRSLLTHTKSTLHPSARALALSDVPRTRLRIGTIQPAQSASPPRCTQLRPPWFALFGSQSRSGPCSVAHHRHPQPFETCSTRAAASLAPQGWLSSERDTRPGRMKKKVSAPITCGSCSPLRHRPSSATLFGAARTLVGRLGVSAVRCYFLDASRPMVQLTNTGEHSSQFMPERGWASRLPIGVAPMLTRCGYASLS